MGDGFQTLVAQPNFTCFKSNWEMSVTYFQHSLFIYIEKTNVNMKDFAMTCISITDLHLLE